MMQRNGLLKAIHSTQRNQEGSDMQKLAYEVQGKNTAAQNQVCAAPQPYSELETILSRINTAIASASVNNDKACATASKLLGEQPASIGKDCARPVRSGLVGEIQDRLDALADVLMSCDAHLNRLNDAI